MRKHQLKLADRQCRMAELSQRLQDLVVMLTTSLWAGRQSSEVVRDAADILCQDLRRKLTGKRPSDALLPRRHQARRRRSPRAASRPSPGIEPEEILMPYAASPTRSRQSEPVASRGVTAVLATGSGPA